MNNKILYAAATLIMGVSACTMEESFNEVSQNASDKVSVIREGAVEGELLVRFDPRVSQILDEAGLITKSGEASASRSGILSVDEILDLVDGYQIERVFPVDSRSEEKAREEGLHLWYVVRFSEEHSVDKVAADLAQLGEVSRVEFNRTLKKAPDSKVYPVSASDLKAINSAKSAKFNDELLGLQWHLVNDGDLGPTKFVKGADVQIEKAWDLSVGDPSIIVAVLDEGVDFNHPDLKNNMWINEGEVWRSTEDHDGNGYAGDVYGYNFAAKSGVVSTSNRYDTGHGTHVAGVIAASNDNGIGISSIAGGDSSNPGVKIMSCQIFSGNIAGTLLDEVRAIKYAADNGAVILQCSWGYISGAANPFEWSPQFADDDQWKSYNVLEFKALDYFLHNAGSPDGVIDGGVIVFAAGNESAPAASYPAAYSDYISVAGTAADYTPAVYTNYGMGTTICAPGGDWDYYYEYGEGETVGRLGCVLSTLPFSVTGEGEMAGYGYMEGTSMACPHVSGVVALGLSYAKKLGKHFKAEEIKDLLYKSARPLESYWDMAEPKLYYKYVADLHDVHLSSMNLRNFNGKMGHGQVDAYSFLKAIEGDDAGVKMSFPNVYLATGASATYSPAMYFENGDKLVFTVTFKDNTIAECKSVGKNIEFKGLKAGQTTATISASGVSQDFTVTVRERAAGNGWL